MKVSVYGSGLLDERADSVVVSEGCCVRKVLEDRRRLVSVYQNRHLKGSITNFKILVPGMYIYLLALYF